MNKFIPLMLGLTLLGGSMAIAAPTAPLAKSHSKVCKKVSHKKVASKKTANRLISKK